MIEAPLAVAAVIAGITAFSFWLDRRYAWAAKVGAGLIVIGLGAVVSNLGLVPASSPVYEAITGPITSLAIVWLLFAVDLRDLKAAGPLMLGAFGIAVAATAVGAVTSTFIFADFLGENAWKLGAAMTGTYSGGSLNFVSVGRELDIPAALFAAANAADAVMTAVWMGATIILPVYIGRYYVRRVPEKVEAPGREVGPVARSDARALDGDGATGGRRDEAAGPRDPEVSHAAETAVDPEAAARLADEAAKSGCPADTTDHRSPVTDRERSEQDVHEHPFFAQVPLRIIDLSILLTLALALLLLADLLAARMRGIPSVLWLTTFALLVGHVPAVQRLAGAMQLGTLALHLFLAIIGVYSRIAEMLRVGPEIFYFTAVVVAIHGTLVYLGGRAARLDVGTTSVASQAAVGGPASAIALAVARDWPALALPGIVAGLLGYAMGNYVAFGVAWFLQLALGG